MKKGLLDSFGGGERYSHSLGFTLAEVLVTLGIIGVISAMTLPTLVKNHQRQVYVTKLKGTISLLSQATEGTINKYNAVSLIEAGVSNQSRMGEFITSQLKTIKSCTGPSDCFGDSYKNLKGNYVALNDTNASCYILANEASICAVYSSEYFEDTEYVTPTGKPHTIEEEIEYVEKNLSVGRFTIDVNGKHGPNILGRDLFSIGLLSDGTLKSFTSADGATGSIEEYMADCQSVNNMTRIGAQACFRVIQESGWKMDY